MEDDIFSNMCSNCKTPSSNLGVIGGHRLVCHTCCLGLLLGTSSRRSAPPTPPPDPPKPPLGLNDSCVSVLLTGLQGAAHLNGKTGVILDVDGAEAAALQAAGRVKVRVDGNERRCLGVRPCNLKSISLAEQQAEAYVIFASLDGSGIHGARRLACPEEIHAFIAQGAADGAEQRTKPADVRCWRCDTSRASTKLSALGASLQRAPCASGAPRAP
jgi:hypothetical protein